MDENKLDIFDPAIIMAFVAAFIGDFSFFLIITHYLCGIIALGTFFPKSKGWMAKGVLILAFLLPLPTLLLGLLLAIVLSNKFLAFIAEQVVIQAIAIGTAGAGEALEAGALGAEGVAMATEATEGVVAATEGVTAAEGAEVAAEAGEAGGNLEKGKEVIEKGKDIADKAQEVRERLRAGDEEEKRTPEEIEAQAKQKELDESMLTEQERPINEVLEEKLFGEPMQIPKPLETEEEPIKRKPKIQDIKPQGEKPKLIQQAPIQIPTEDEDKEEGERLKKAA